MKFGLVVTQYQKKGQAVLPDVIKYNTALKKLKFWCSGVQFTRLDV